MAGMARGCVGFAICPTFPSKYSEEPSTDKMDKSLRTIHNQADGAQSSVATD
jgi:hypothetical protein